MKQKRNIAPYIPAATAIKKEVNPQTRVGSKIALEPGDQLNLLGPNSKVERREDNSLYSEKLEYGAGRMNSTFFAVALLLRSCS